MKPQLGIQLYSVRENLQKDFDKTLSDIATMGYQGVEIAGVPEGSTYKQAGDLIKKHHLTPAGAHISIPIGADKNKTLDEMGQLGCTVIISGKWPDDFASVDAIRRTCDMYNEAVQVAFENGMTFGVHNHWWEYQMCEGRPAYQILLDNLDPRVFFELDTYWVATAGLNPVSVIQELGERVRYLHVKDGPCKQGEHSVVLGKGKMNYVPIVKAAQSVTWYIVEFDSCATDIMTAVKESHDYLVSII